jgi:hypothetical protein
MSAEDRLRLAFELMSFGLDRLREQAARRGCTVRELRHVYEHATARLRARG